MELAPGALPSPSALSISRLRKTFAGVTVLDVAGLEVRYGEVFGLIGENGAGKSTLVKTLAGVHSPDGGSHCAIAGHEVSFPIVRPQAYGMAFIHQDLALYDNMSIAENIGIASHYDAAPFGIYHKERELEIARALLARFDVHLDPQARCSTLSSAERSLVAILRALRQLDKHQGRSILVLDEPTAALTRTESLRLLEIVRQLASSGIAVIFIGHRLQEIMKVCDRVGVLRNGSLVATVNSADATPKSLVSLMLGTELEDFYPAKLDETTQGDALRVTRLSGGALRDVSFTIGSGEILGVTGLMGMGQEALPYLLYGSQEPISGEIQVDGRGVATGSIQASIAARMVLVPGNRHRDSIWALGSGMENLTLPVMPDFFRAGIIDRSREKDVATREMKRLGVRPLNPQMPIAGLSGGNQQKVVLARWMNTRPKVLLLHEPTQGVDAGAKREVFDLVRMAAAEGAGVLVVSSDIEEVANVCHRVLVLHHGEIKTTLDGEMVTEEAIAIASQQHTDTGVTE